MGKTMMELVDSDELLGTVKMHGPLVPIDVRRILKKGDSITIGAGLSQLVHGKHVLVTNVKRGGSPFYYTPGTESRLDSIADNLNGKDKQTYDMLKSQKVMRDSAQDPLTRVSLREIKDFSRSFTITVNGEKETFWRYFLVDEPEAIRILRERYAPRKEEIKVPPEMEKKIEQQTQQMQKPIEQEKVEQPKHIQKEEKIQEQKQKPKQSAIKKETNTHEKQKSLTEEYEEKEDIFQTVEDEFLDKIKKFFDNNDVTVKDAELIRKGSEYNFIIEMNTPMGNAEYFCKAKSKKKSGDGDLSQAYLQGQTRRVPTVYLTTGEVTKKAKEKTSTDYKGMLIKEL